MDALPKFNKFLDLSQVDEDSLIVYGDNEITTLCEQFDLDVDAT